MAGERKDPAFLFYATTWLQSEVVRTMKLEARGAYVELLSFAWLHGSIPADQGKLAAILGVTRAKFRRLWAALEPCWRPAADGRLVNERQEHERAERRQKAEQLREKGRKGGLRSTGSRNHSSSTDQAQLKHSSSTARPVLKPSTSNSTTSPTPPSEEGPSPEGQGGRAPRGAEPEPAAARPGPLTGGDPPDCSADTAVEELTDALIETPYRSGITPSVRRRSVLRKKASWLAATLLTPPDVLQLAALARTKSKGDPGALMAHWLDGDPPAWRSVIDEQRSKQKTKLARSRAQAQLDPTAGADVAGDVLQHLNPRNAST